MCGIAGILERKGQAADPRILERMLVPIANRGPDGRGVHLEGPLGLGHVRLSIIDLDGGRQPMHNEDRSVWVTFNGEIFNYLELAETLRGRGHRFATRSDTEVILHAYEEYGEDCVRHFNGQWAFALWDARRRKLLLSRDRLGVRPLFYTTAGPTLLFASTMRSLLAHTAVGRQLDPVGLDQVFTFWATIPPRTVLRGICELPPGHNLVAEGEALRTRAYWQPDFNPDPRPESEAQSAERLLELLADATRLRLRSDVPVGAYLSGGLDSTVTTALAARYVPRHLRTFSITFDDAEFDESRHQRQAVEYLHTDHRQMHCRAADIARVFPQVIWHAERPILRTAPAPMYLLAELVRREGYKVVLTGEGADEMLGGYDIFKEAKVRRFLAARPESAFRARLLAKLYPYLPRLQAQSLAYRKAFFHVRPEDLASPWFSHLPRWELTARLKQFFSRELRSELAGRDACADALAVLPAAFEGWDFFSRAQYLETTLLLPGYILSSQGDRMAMAHAVEGRFPFLDYRVVEYAASLPWRMKMKGLDEKHILKRAAVGLVPPAVLARSKQPYRAPDAACFLPPSGPAPEYVETLLSPRRIGQDGLFDPQAVAHLVAKFRRGEAIGVKDNMALVGILSTELVLEQFTGQPLAASQGSSLPPPAAPLPLGAAGSRLADGTALPASTIY
ncbi:MAG: asparagine synthase (glutamine-hydrolyzing) [Thermoguttaceae bacterium]|jgi:asparagine synthase (glutamine-hydrolysing)